MDTGTKRIGALSGYRSPGWIRQTGSREQAEVEFASMRRVKLLAATVVVTLALLAGLPTGANRALAVSGGQGLSIDVPGFDDCNLPPTSTMDTWWFYSPYYWYGTYIGGESLAGAAQGCNPLPTGSLASIRLAARDGGLSTSG